MADNARVALVAGGSGEIGGAVSRKLAADGARIYVGYRSRPEGANDTVKAIVAAGGDAVSIALDLDVSDRSDAVCTEIFDREGRLDILVNCAAINREAPALGMDDDVWEAVLRTNLNGAFRLARAAAQYMMLGRWGRIVQLSSTAARRGGRGQINYAASKAGVEAMTRVLALELGRKGILVNGVAPGIIETAMSERIRAEHGTAILEYVSVRRFGQPGEVAEAVAFLASERASYINGQILRVDGGML